MNDCHGHRLDQVLYSLLVLIVLAIVTVAGLIVGALVAFISQ